MPVRSPIDELSTLATRFKFEETGTCQRRIVACEPKVPMSKAVDQLAGEILAAAKARGQTVATAESCTAGRLALALSKAEGASKHFMGGIVAYTKNMKVRVLGVAPELIRAKTAVSGEVAEAMALGALQRSGASVAVSITGVAGPEEDEDGLVFCGVARDGCGQTHVRLQCAGKPDAVIEQACLGALNLLRSFCFS
jgi:nicotinamide-nucleotide amidase